MPTRHRGILAAAIVALFIGAAVVVLRFSGVGPTPGLHDPEPAPPAADASYDFRRVDAAVRELMETYGVDGASMQVARGGEVIYAQHWGGFDGDTTVTVGSASKWMSVAAVMSLVEDGTLSLDDTVGQYLPFFPEAQRSITLEQLLSHTSGLKRRTDCVQEYQISLLDCVQRIASEPVRAEPGVEFRYGGVSTHVAAGMAEVATGRPWRELFQERIVEPLGLTNTQYGVHGLSANPGVAGNIRTSSTDHLRFLQMLLDGGRFEGRQVLAPETVALMEAGHTHGLPREGHLPRRHTTTPHDLYGLGVWRDVVDDQGRAVVVSAPGKFGAAPWIDRELGLAGIFLVEIKNGGEVAEARPDPAGIMYLVCDVVDQHDRGARADDAEPNPRCLIPKRREASGWPP